MAGCSTGEEAYSFAIALLEYLGGHAGSIKIQIFGTDLSERGIQVARNGLYADSAVENVSRDRLRQFFLKTEGGYQIARSIREMCIFARHDLAKDPPFAKLDLISCQNVFIYLGRALQKRIMAGFHYALKPSGFLVLGKSETPMAYTDFFALEDRKNKIFSRKPVTVRPHPAMPKSHRSRKLIQWRRRLPRPQPRTWLKRPAVSFSRTIQPLHSLWTPI